MIRIKRFFYLLPFIFFFCSQAEASVVLQGNRVIFDASSKNQSVKFTNNDSFPYIVQVWTSVNNEEKFSEKNNTPFVLSPAVFKIQPHADQMVNMIYSNVGRKLDKEQIYYLHFTQIPAITTDMKDKNKLLLIVNSVVKVFVRPNGMSVSHDDMFSYVHYSVIRSGSTCRLVINNHSPYFLNSVAFSVKNQQDQKIGMIPPKSNIEVNSACAGLESAPTLSLSYINDYGVVQKTDIKKK